MPVKVRKGGGSCSDDEFAVIDDKGKTHGCHASKDKAQRQMRAINSNSKEQVCIRCRGNESEPHNWPLRPCTRCEGTGLEP